MVSLPFLEWFTSNRGFLHDNVELFAGPQGISARALKALPPNAPVVSCPFALAITPRSAREPLRHFFSLEPAVQACLSDRQLLCAYIALHWLVPEQDDIIPLLHHRPYVDFLPHPDRLLTPLYFSEQEVNFFRGSNLYNATIDQRETLQAEWRDLCTVIRSARSGVIESIPWDMYLKASTYLSSRAFPSTLLSTNPTSASPTSYPVLLPGLDLLNHARMQPITWLVDYAISRPVTNAPLDSTSGEVAAKDKDLQISIVLNAGAHEGAEIFNNYGPKPNASFILSYGFAMEDNPDDTIVLKVGTGGGPASGTSMSTGAPQQAMKRTEYEIGRNASGVEALWNDVRAHIALNYRNLFVGYSTTDEGDYELAEKKSDDDKEHPAMRDLHIDIQTTHTLLGMVTDKLCCLPPREIDANITNDPESYQAIRESVKNMYGAYISGQHDILETLQEWLEQKDRDSERQAREAGFVIEDDEDE